jgi:hypothetical protein
MAMKLWEYLLAANKKLDLSDPERARKWFCSQPWWGAPALGEGVGWTERAREKWPSNLKTLRSLARRLKGTRSKQPFSAEDRQADRVLHDYLGMLRVCVNDKRPVLTDPWTKKTFGGLVVLPTWSDSRHPATHPFFTPILYLQDDLDFFWQCVFYSLVSDGGEVFCAGCGRPLGDKTPGGRPKKQQLCDRCRWRKWRVKQPLEKMRAKWREDKKNHP